jgi:hypothetical protein
MDDGVERKENKRGFRQDTTLTSSWTELEHQQKYFRIAGNSVNTSADLLRDPLIVTLRPPNVRN